jgi:toxin HigB-1
MRAAPATQSVGRGIPLSLMSLVKIRIVRRNKPVDTVTEDVTIHRMIESFRHKGLAELFEAGQSRRVRQDLQSRCLRRLEALDQAEVISDLNVPGFNFHGLHGSPKRYSIHVNGPWCITLEWRDADALHVDFEQYH